MRSCRCQLWIWRSQMQFYWRRELKSCRCQLWIWRSQIVLLATLIEELSVSIVDLTIANAVLLATRSGATKTGICDRQIHNWHRQLFNYSSYSYSFEIIPNVYTLVWKHTNKWRNICTFQIFKIRDIFRITVGVLHSLSRVVATLHSISVNAHFTRFL